MTFSAILFYILAAIVLYGCGSYPLPLKTLFTPLCIWVLTFCVSAMIWMLMQAGFWALRWWWFTSAP